MGAFHGPDGQHDTRIDIAQHVVRPVTPYAALMSCYSPFLGTGSNFVKTPGSQIPPSSTIARIRMLVSTIYDLL